MNPKFGKLVLVSGPTAVGKDTLVDRFRAEFVQIKKVLSTTTRAERKIEKNTDFRFISEDEFKSHIKNNDFLEYAKVHEHYYGTLKKDVFDLLEKGNLLIKVIDVDGMKIITDFFNSHKLKQNLFSIFIEPENLEVLKQRILARGTETPEEIDIRLKRVKKELSQKSNYDYVLKSSTKEKDYAEFKKVLNGFYFV